MAKHTFKILRCEQILLCQIQFFSSKIKVALAVVRKYMKNFTGYFDFLYFQEMNEILETNNTSTKNKNHLKNGYNTLE